MPLFLQELLDLTAWLSTLSLDKDDFLYRIRRHAGEQQHQVAFPLLPHVVPLARDDYHYIAGADAACLAIDADPALATEDKVHLLWYGTQSRPQLDL